MTSKETSNVELACPLCTNTPSLKFTRISDYLKHQRLFHVHQANFRLTCGIGGCKRSYTNIGTFQNHVYSVHYCKNDDTSFSENTSDYNATTSDIFDNNDECGDFNHDVDENSFADNESAQFANNESARDSLHCSSNPLQNSSALFLLGLKEKYKLTQVAIQGVIEGVSSLSQHQMSLLRAQVFEARVYFAYTVAWYTYRFLIHYIKQILCHQI